MGKQITIKRLVLGDRGIKGLYFSDFHYKGKLSEPYMKRLRAIVIREKPDFIMCLGDLIDYNYGLECDRLPVVAGLRELYAPYGKYAVYGNHERNNGREDRYKDVLNRGAFRLLVNSEVVLNIRGHKIGLTGLDDGLLGDIECVPMVKACDYRIVMVHEPDVVDYLEGYPFQLQVSGHTHGGQVRLPLLGRLVSVRGGRHYDKGYYEIEENKGLYVSSGIGNSRLPIRVGNCPEVVVLEI